MEASGSSAPARSPRFWREPTFWVTVVLTAAVYFSRLSALTIRGEESRWANVAREMSAAGDWVVPREQGAVFVNRPPLVNWCLGAATNIAGNQNAATLRFPSALATLATALVTYLVGRTFLSPSGAMAGGVMFATMGQVLQLGAQAETEPIFTLCVAGSLLGWLGLYMQRRPPWLIWCVGYFFAALAGLAKGPQGPIYFVGTTWLFTLCCERRLLLSRGHLLGLIVFAAAIAAWQVPFVSAVGAEQGWAVWTGQAGARFRFQPDGWDRTWKHAVSFPWELLACMLPWSILLFGFFDRQLRINLGAARRPVQFLAIASVVGFLPLWFAFAARGRYYMPLYPCVALLTAVVVEKISLRLVSERFLKIWRGLLVADAACVLGLGLAIAVAATPASFVPSRFAQPPLWAAAIGLAAIAVTALLLRARRTPAPAAVAVVASAALCGLLYVGPVFNATANYSRDTRAEVSQLIDRLPPDAELVSLETVHHLFGYHLAAVGGREVRLISADELPSLEAASPSRPVFFCVNSYGATAQSLPFAWEQVGVVVVDRNRYDVPRDFVAVGRKLPSIPIAPESSLPELRAAEHSPTRVVR